MARMYCIAFALASLLIAAAMMPTGVCAQPPVTITPLNINTEDFDYAPTITADGVTMYFCSDRDGGVGKHDLWKATMNGSPEQGLFTATNLGAPVNTSKSEGVASITADGQTIYFTGCERDDGFGDCDIYVADLVDGAFTNVRNLGALNTMYWDSQPTVSADGMTLCFASNRPGCLGGEGDKDIFVSTMQADGSWSPPVNMGAPVNTEEREDSPFLHSGGDRLYYATAGYAGEGGLDFVVSHLTRDGWSAPQNLGVPINSGRDERFITVPASGRHIYFSSERRDIENLGHLDLYVATVAETAPNSSEGATLAVLVSPNPATDRVIVKLVTEGTATTNEHVLAVSDATGAEVTRLTFSGDRTELSLEKFANGIHVLRVDGRSARFIVKR